MPDKILVDTSVWIEFFRKKESPLSFRLREHLKLNRACYIGPVAVELYQGAKTAKEVQVIHTLLETITYVEITRSHYHHAGELSHQAARSGRIFSIVDLVIAVVAHDEQLKLFSLDAHFRQISQICPLQLESF